MISLLLLACAHMRTTPLTWSMPYSDSGNIYHEAGLPAFLYLPVSADEHPASMSGIIMASSH